MSVTGSDIGPPSLNESCQRRGILALENGLADRLKKPPLRPKGCFWLFLAVLGCFADAGAGLGSKLAPVSVAGR